MGQQVSEEEHLEDLETATASKQIAAAAGEPLPLWVACAWEAGRPVGLRDPSEAALPLADVAPPPSAAAVGEVATKAPPPLPASFAAEEGCFAAQTLASSAEPEVCKTRDVVDCCQPTMPSDKNLTLLDAFAPGQRVRVVGAGSGRNDLYGQEGTVADLDEEGRWKVVLDSKECVSFYERDLGPVCELPPRGFKLKDMFMPGAVVRVFGLKDALDPRGSEGTVVRWCASEGRWKVRLADGSAKLCRPAHLELVSRPRGRRSRISRGGGQSPCADGPHAPVTFQSTCDAEASAAMQEPDACGLPVRDGAFVRVRGLQRTHSLNGQCGVVMCWDVEELSWKVRMSDGSGKLLKESNLEVLHVGHGSFEAATSSGARSCGYAPSMSSTPTAPSRRNRRSRRSLASTSSHLTSDMTAEDEFLIGRRVRMNELRAEVGPQGSEGRLVRWDGVSGRWRIHLDSGARTWATLTSFEVLRPIELVPLHDLRHDDAGGRLAPGRRGRVCSLSKNEQVNGQVFGVDRALGDAPPSDGAPCAPRRVPRQAPAATTVPPTPVMSATPSTVEEGVLKQTAFQAVVKDDVEKLTPVLEALPAAVWSAWRNRAGTDLLGLAQERGSPTAYSALVKALGLVAELPRDTFEERETVWVYRPGETQPRRATVMEHTPVEADAVLCEYWDGDEPASYLDRGMLRKMAT